jgi:prepilin-type N-terminal cleavage/methylation domain-containing protein
MVSYERRGRKGFTLVEMLVSVAVLVLILTFTAQMMNSTMISTGLSGKHVDTDSEARMVFDRMSKDFAGMPQRKDIDFVFAKQAGPSATTGSSDEMFFYSEAPAYYPTGNAALFVTPDPKSSMSLVGYYVNPGIANSGTNGVPPAYCLQRLSRGLTWDGNIPAGTGPGSMSFLTFPGGGATYSPFLASTLSGGFSGVGAAPSYSGTDSDFDVLANEVLRMEFCFQVKDLRVPGQAGTAYSNYPVAQWGVATANRTVISSTDPPLTTGSNTAGDRWYNAVSNRAYVCTNSSSASASWAPNGMADVRAIVVAIAILDSNSRKIMTPAQLGNAAMNLPDFQEPSLSAATSPTLMATAWQSALNKTNPTFASTAVIPSAAAAQIRVYQRYFSLNNF